MSHQLLEAAEQASMKKSVPEFSVGNTVDVHTKIVEGGKERIQIFTGTVIAKKGRGVNTMFKVRRIVNQEGVERTFMLHSPRVVDVQVKRVGKVRRSKLYFLRERVGKKVKLREVRGSRGGKKKSQQGGHSNATSSEPVLEEPVEVGA
jgi:large subunit ribosomal protein L19